MKTARFLLLSVFQFRPLKSVRWRIHAFQDEEDLSVNIFVGNLAFTTTNHDLRQLFEPYGVVDEIRVITDRDTGRSKGFGFVEMPDSTTAKTAIAGLQGQELEGRTLTVNEAKPRAPRREPSRSRW
jgi:cold-inducible RNA-binding protein